METKRASQAGKKVQILMFSMRFDREALKSECGKYFKGTIPHICTNNGNLCVKWWQYGWSEYTVHWVLLASRRAWIVCLDEAIQFNTWCHVVIVKKIKNDGFTPQFMEWLWINVFLWLNLSHLFFRCVTLGGFAYAVLFLALAKHPASVRSVGCYFEQLTPADVYIFFTHASCISVPWISSKNVLQLLLFKAFHIVLFIKAIRRIFQWFCIIYYGYK